MKRDLAVRAGAIVLGLVIAFFSILPDLVNAEGDEAGQETTVEIVAEGSVADAPETDMPQTDASETETTDAADTDVSGSESQPAEVPDTETEDSSQPAEDTDTEEPADTEESGDDVLDTETDSDMKTDPDSEAAAPEDKTETENPSGEPSFEGVENISGSTDGAAQEETTAPAETQDTDSGEMDTVQDYMAILDLVYTGEKGKFSTNRTIDASGAKELADFLEGEEDDFLVEGTTLLGYQGPGGYVKIPDKITAIGDSAFAGNTSIYGIEFPAVLQTIGNSAFNGCINLEAVSIPDSVTTVGTAAFANCTALSGLNIGSGTGTIALDEFNNCISLQNVSVPEGISSISAGAFGNCSNLGSISLPATLASLDRNAFSGDMNLASINVASGSYSSYDGCVYSADGRQLLLCPQGKTGISLAPGMTSVASGAFSGCAYLLSAVIPESAGAIEANAFSGSAIKSVTIPTSVTSIGSQAGWTPNVIYGYTGSAAENWAVASNYVFERLDGSPYTGSGRPEEHIEDEDVADDPQRGGSGLVTPGVNAAGSAAGTSASISRNGVSRVNATPKTGVEDYRIYFLFGGLLLSSMAMLSFSRKLRLEVKRR